MSRKRKRPGPTDEPKDEGLLRRYRALIEANPDLILRMDGNGRYLDFHAGDQVRLAYPPEDFIGRKPSDLFEPKFAEAAETCIRKALETGKMQIWEYPLRIDDETREYEARIVPSGGNEVVTIIRDITESKRTQEQLLLSKSRSKEAQRMAKVGNWERNLVTDEVWWSEETYRIFGVDPATSVTFNTFMQRIHPEDRERVSHEVDVAHREGELVELRCRVLLPEGTVKTVSGRAQLVTGENGRAKKMIGVVQDITELTELNARLEEQNAELAARDQSKEMLLAMLGHELRNPVGSIRNSLDILSVAPTGPAGDGDRKLALGVLQRQSDQLHSLLQNLLDLEQIKHGKFELHLESVDLRQLAREIADLYRGRAENSGLAVKVRVPAESVHVRADRARLQQILENLLDNALRFTEEGEIAICVRKGTENAEVMVRDTGIGIDRDEAALLFEPFYQSSYGKSGVGSLGFGLALVKRLVERHGSTIDVRSDGPGTGTAFTFALPLAQPGEKSQEIPSTRKASVSSQPGC